MSYDFNFVSLRLGAETEYPLSAARFSMHEWSRISSPIQDEERFWGLVDSFHNIERDGSRGDETRCFLGMRFPGCGFMVYRAPAPEGASGTVAAVERFQAGLQNPGADAEAALEGFVQECGRQPLGGVRLDMSGSWYDVLDFFRHLKAEFPSLFILDLQEGLVHDESSFARFLDERGAK
jgi:hypothetical protein